MTRVRKSSYETTRDRDEYEDGLHSPICTCVPCVERADVYMSRVALHEHGDWCRCSLHRGKRTLIDWRDETRDAIGGDTFEENFTGVQERWERNAS